MSEPLPWRQSHDAPGPTNQTIADAIQQGAGLIWPNNESATAYAVSHCADGSWLLTILYCGRHDWSQPYGNIFALIRAMREIAPIWQWERRVGTGRLLLGPTTAGCNCVRAG